MIARCCKENIKNRTAVWSKADSFAGPDEDGWTIGEYALDDVYYVNVNYCPYCGIKLEDIDG